MRGNFDAWLGLTRYNGRGGAHARVAFRPMTADVTPRTDPAQVDVSVVVATYNAKRRGELDACLSAIDRQTVAPLDVIVVVDHNPDLLASVSEAFS